MYKKQKAINIKGSTSALCNNLSILRNYERGIVSYAVVHKSVINLVSWADEGSTVNHRQIVCKEPSASNSTTIVLQAKLVEARDRLILVIASQRGVQMFEADSAAMLFWHALGEGGDGEASACYSRGICAVNLKNSSSICVGVHSGSILMFNIPARGTNINLADTKKEHRVGIVDLCSNNDIGRVGSSDELGNIVIWEQTSQSIEKLFKINGDGYPCTSLALWRNAAVAAFGTGHLRVYNMNEGQISCEVLAHGRAITAIDVADNGTLLTVAEDSLINVWQLEDRKMPKIDHIHSDSVTDVQLQGAQFSDKRKGKDFCVTGYDNSEIMTFSRT